MLVSQRFHNRYRLYEITFRRPPPRLVPQSAACPLARGAQQHALHNPEISFVAGEFVDDFLSLF